MLVDYCWSTKHKNAIPYPILRDHTLLSVWLRFDNFKRYIDLLQTDHSNKDAFAFFNILWHY